MRKTKVDAMRADSDSSRVREPPAPLSIAEFSKRQVAMIEWQILSATDLADLIDLSMTGIRQLSGGSQVEIWLHDPVDELDRHLDVIGVLSGTVRLLEDIGFCLAIQRRASMESDGIRRV